ncbi:MAG: hypothetical protein ACI4QY_01375 [Oscillospiraceae bacterium]
MTQITVTENGNVRGVFTRVISASLTDSLNGECTFEFTVISSAASEVFTGLEVELKSDTLNYLFNVVKVSKSLVGGIAVCTVECEHKSYELNNDEYKLTEFDFEGVPSECLISLLQGTSMTAGICDPTIPIKLKINRECTRRAALMQLIALCGGEIEYNGNEINIRSHRGSQEYIGIMDGRNVSDLTMETDSRSGTTSYGLTLYKNVNFSVGDNVQIVFRPFDLNVNTRIISMSFNPFNRCEISIEVGDYRPSISDSLYQMEQAANKLRDDVGESTANIKTATNNTVISISEKQQRLFRISFNAVKATYSSFCSTVKFTISTAGTVAFILKQDQNEVMRYEEYFSEGSHVKTYTYPFISENKLNNIEFYVYSADGAEGVFPKMQSWGYVMGAYLAGDNPWDGYIELRETEICFTMRRFERKTLAVTTDTLHCELPYLYKFAFDESKLFFIKRKRERKVLEPTVSVVLPNSWSPKLITPPPITVVNISNRKLYIELRNPVTADAISTAAFTMIVTTETETMRLQPVSADFGTGDFGSTIWLTFGSSAMKDSVQSITLLYDGDVGNLIDVLNDIPCGSFQTSFIYTPYEEEQE